MVWNNFNTLSSLIPTELHLNAATYLGTVADHIHPFSTTESESEYFNNPEGN